MGSAGRLRRPRVERGSPIGLEDFLHEDEDQAASTPFDNPYFLPVLLWAFAAYFGYDIVTDAEAYQKYPLFNQGGFALLSVLAIYYTWSAIREKRDEPRD